MATLSSGKKVHFGSSKYPDYLIHQDKERRDKYLARAKKIKNKQGELTYTNPESSNLLECTSTLVRKKSELKI